MWPSPQSLLTQPLDAMETAYGTLGQHVMPNPPGAIGPVAAAEAGLNLRAKDFIAACSSAGRPGKPRTKSTMRDTERPAKPSHRPNSSMFRDEAEFYNDSLAK